MATAEVVEVLDVVRHSDREFDNGRPALSIEQFDLH
jgi:hypothetical protein